MELNATTRALSQPHIVQAICNELPDDSLAVAACINHDFFVFATETKWNTEPPLWALQQRVQLSRRQLYASKVRSLALDDMAMRKYLHACRKVHFSGMKKLILERYGVEWVSDDSKMNYGFMHLYLPEQLEALVLSECSPTNPLLGALAERCHRLRSLRLPAYAPRFDFEALAALMAANPLLEELDLHPRIFRIREVLPTPLLLQCARQRNLRSIRLPSTMQASAEQFRRIEAEISEPFPALQKLAWADLPSIALPLLSKWCRNMSELLISIHDKDVPVLEALSNMTKLKQARLHVPQEMTMSRSEIMALTSLQRLEDFSYTVYSSRMSTTEFSLTANEFEKWIAHFPALREFEMEVDVRLPRGYDSALATLARCCPHIERLKWPTHIDFSELDLESLSTPLFPNLQFLTVSFAATDVYEEKFPYNYSKEEVVKVLCHHFPKLFRFTIQSPDGCEGVEIIRKAFRTYEDKNTPKNWDPWA
ncbi:hypothetical protein CCM_02832 [Cordyceps militaris CM01]|uniref:F-box domain-containing protein n=1 Tax=Cordyceps militaris (strain CM01) TaxID=983644 RepID=G3JC46_CORMM|nr:uncharacterized protein CCM_02832 [Cordyceps militaris CM01]EGX94561.1 hypothetical protein CCM_02832 [Cordyceps militaris CM01]